MQSQCSKRGCNFTDGASLSSSPTRKTFAEKAHEFSVKLAPQDLGRGKTVIQRLKERELEKVVVISKGLCHKRVSCCGTTDLKLSCSQGTDELSVPCESSVMTNNNAGLADIFDANAIDEGVEHNQCCCSS